MIRITIICIFFIITSSVAQENSSIIIQNIDSKMLQKVINNRNGKILLVNIWATWCIPCREEFPDLVKLYNENLFDLEVMAISVDYPDEINSKIKPFLVANKVPFPVYLSSFANDEELINTLNHKWNGALPGTFIYDGEGKQIKMLEGKQTFQDLSSIVQKLKRR